jgi:hypothetical protein
MKSILAVIAFALLSLSGPAQKAQEPTPPSGHDAAGNELPAWLELRGDRLFVKLSDAFSYERAPPP